MPNYTEDSRVPVKYSTRTVDGKTGKQKYFREVTLKRANGTVHTFSGSNTGRFIPGEFRVNPMSASRTTYLYGSGLVRYENTRSGNYDIVTDEGFFTARTAFKAPSAAKVADWDPGLMGYVTQKAYAELITGDMDLGEFLAELPETISMVRGGVGLIQRAIAKASQGGFTWNRANRARLALLRGISLKNLPRKVANAWLTWRYGIRPLIWDVQDLIRAANSLAMKSDWSGLQRRRARASKQDSQSFSYSMPAFTGYISLGAREYVEIQRKGEAVVYFRYGTNWGPIQDILLKYGLHPNQFPYLLWQLAPLSFMLDWFVDVGSWVRAISPKWGLKVYGCSASQKTSVRAYRICTPEPVWFASYTSTTPIHDQYVVEKINRRLQTLPGEIPRLKPKVILSIQQQCDLLSVLLQRALSNRRH